MSRRSSGRSVVGLILEIGFIALVVSVLPKLNFRAQAPATPATAAAPNSAAPWWQAEPSALPTSWRPDDPQPVNVEQTLQNASRQFLQGAADFAGKTASEIVTEPGASKPIEARPRRWNY